MTPSSTTSLFIGLSSLGSLFHLARRNPLGLDQARRASETLNGLKVFISGQDKSFLPLAQKLDLTDPERAAEGLREFYDHLLQSDELRLRLTQMLRVEERLTAPAVLDSVIHWRLKHKKSPLLSLLVTPAVAARGAFPERASESLLDSLLPVHELQLLAGVALMVEQTGRLFDAEVLYKWYLVAEEEVGPREPEIKVWGLERLIAVLEAQGKSDQVRRLQAPELPAGAAADPAAARYPATPTDVYQRFRSDLMEIDPDGPDFFLEVRFFISILSPVPREILFWRGFGIDFASAILRWIDAIEGFWMVRQGEGLTDAFRQEFSSLRDSFPPLPSASSADDDGLQIDWDEGALQTHREAPAAGTRNTWTFDQSEKGAVPTAELVQLVRQQLGEISSGDNIIILYRIPKVINILQELSRDAEAIRAAVETSENLPNLSGGAIFLRAVGVNMQYRITVDTSGSVPHVKADLLSWRQSIAK